VIISIASGKGGTGKTTVAASMASVFSGSVYIDCDVEEPNGHLMLKPEFKNEETVYKLLPKIDYNKCNLCGRCVDVCEFNALINIKFEIVIIEELCHSCGACSYFCPGKAITEVEKEIGVVRSGMFNGNSFFFDGLLRVGEVSAVPLIKKVKEKTSTKNITIIDSPPGTSCSMVETVKDSDYCVLVTESSPFGLSDLKLAVGVLKTINIPFGVIINKYSENFPDTEKYLKEENIRLLLKIPFDREIAENYSKGILPVELSEKLKEEFLSVLNEIRVEVESTGINAG